MDFNKLSSELHHLISHLEFSGHPGIEDEIGVLGIVSELNTSKPARIIIFVHCDEDANFEGTENFGIRINRNSGTVRTAILPVTEIARLSDWPKVKQLSASKILHERMDVSKPMVNLPLPKGNASYTGRGVIIGIVDTGIDPNHPAFSGRIISIWDQTMHGPGVTEGTYGFELTGSNMNVSRDTNGHGTHVAGIAAGEDTNFEGAAPEAELVIVKTSFNDAHIANAIEYIFRKADEANKPAIVNLSLGGHADAHDGTDSLSQVVNQEVGPGKIVCVAAGNEGADNMHAYANVQQGRVESLNFRISAVDDAHLQKTGPIFLNGWYCGQDDFEISMVSPNGFVTPWQKVVLGNIATQSYTNPDGVISVTTPPASPINGDKNFFIKIISTPGLNNMITPGDWKIKIRGNNVFQGDLHVWLLDRSNKVNAIFIGSHASNKMTIGSPGTASEAVTVGSITSRNNWSDIDGNQWSVNDSLNTPSGFSSEGPLRNGGLKPDVIAPGQYICAPLSADSSTARYWMINNNFRLMQGTSMATPFISGMVALLLERDPTLSPTVLKQLLLNASRIPGQPLGSHDTKWGYGFIDAGYL